MAAALDPWHALDFLRLLTPGVTAAAVVGADGVALAGDAALAERIAATPGEYVHAGDLHVARVGATAVGLRTTAPVAERLLERDLRTALESMA